MSEISFSINGKSVARDEFLPRFNAHGLIPVIAQDALRKDVLMLAYMNEEAFLSSLASGYATFWSRSRKELWLKGETSGNKLRIVEAHLDCDSDALLLLVDIEGDGKACHTGARNCFDGASGSMIGSVLDSLEATIESRKSADAHSSYTYKLLNDENLALKKVGEEATEVVMAAKDGNADELRYEAADLLYHLLVVCKREGLTLDDLGEELRGRFK